MQELSTIAAVDLGSNSFRLQVGRVVDEQVYAVDSLREPVRLAAGLSPDGDLDEAAQERAVGVLRRFAQRLRGFPPNTVRAVGTNTLRAARNAAEVLPRLESALGFPIEIVAGREEARLVYVGVAHGLAPSADKRLVVDIGGGSTEFIIGSGITPELTESLYMGCVSWSLKFFPDQRVSKSSMKRAEVAARIEIEAIRKKFSSKYWSEAIGSSGTARAISDVLESNGWCDSGINREGLEKLRSAVIGAGHIAKIDLPGLRGDRLPVLPGGLAIMKAVFDELDVSHMNIASGAMRQGILWDMIGRRRHKDMRETTVRQFMKRYHVDTVQARRVERLAKKLYEQFGSGDDLDYGILLLSWAARLHEIGLSVSHSGFHKHSAYIVSNADMPGFSRMEQQHAAKLVRSHRGSLDKLRNLAADETDWTLLISLRLAVLMYRSRSEKRLPRIVAKKSDSTFTLVIDGGWLNANPLTAAELQDEIAAWRRLGVELSVPELIEVED
ncbi:MAG TPA: Ppx/GppA phosphatase family protein [Burkholderiales bacterium]|nr:Ppx/GppA phosphatase family protein [Burkholderiales bacterium]